MARLEKDRSVGAFFSHLILLVLFFELLGSERVVRLIKLIYAQIGLEFPIARIGLESQGSTQGCFD